MICEALPLVTRLSVAELFDGCWKVTEADDPILNSPQLMIALSELCCTVIALPALVTFADPDTTDGLCGKVVAAGTAACALLMTSNKTDKDTPPRIVRREMACLCLLMLPKRIRMLAFVPQCHFRIRLNPASSHQDSSSPFHSSKKQPRSHQYSQPTPLCLLVFHPLD